MSPSLPVPEYTTTAGISLGSVYSPHYDYCTSTGGTTLYLNGILVLMRYYHSSTHLLGIQHEPSIVWGRRALVRLVASLPLLLLVMQLIHV